MRSKLIVWGLGVGLLLAAAGPVLAHHAFSAEFDANNPIELKGTVVKMEWVNTHTWIHMDVKKPDGKVERWMIEGGTPKSLTRRGYTKASPLAGTEIFFEGIRAKDK